MSTCKLKPIKLRKLGSHSRLVLLTCVLCPHLGRESALSFHSTLHNLGTDKAMLNNRQNTQHMQQESIGIFSNGLYDRFSFACHSKIIRRTFLMCILRAINWRRCTAFVACIGEMRQTCAKFLYDKKKEGRPLRWSRCKWNNIKVFLKKSVVMV